MSSEQVVECLVREMVQPRHGTFYRSWLLRCDGHSVGYTQVGDRGTAGEFALCGHSAVAPASVEAADREARRTGHCDTGPASFVLRSHALMSARTAKDLLEPTWARYQQRAARHLSAALSAPGTSGASLTMLRNFEEEAPFNATAAALVAADAAGDIVLVRADESPDAIVVTGTGTAASTWPQAWKRGQLFIATIKNLDVTELRAASAVAMDLWMNRRADMTVEDCFELAWRLAAVPAGH